MEPQVSENEKGGEVAALGVVTVHKEVKASTPAKPLASSKATDELPQTSKKAHLKENILNRVCFLSVLKAYFFK